MKISDPYLHKGALMVNVTPSKLWIWKYRVLLGISLAIAKILQKLDRD